MRSASLFAAITLAIHATPVTAQAPGGCAAMTDSAARLECYDKGSAAPKAVPPKKPAKPTGGSTAVDNGWELRRIKGGFDDKINCVVSPVGKPFVQFTRGELYISYRGRGGVNGFQYRLDDGPASGMQLPSPIDKQISVVHLSGATFSQIVAAHRLRVSTLTLIAGLHVEDLQLDGMHGLYRQLERECP